MATNILHVYDIICFRNKIPNKSFFDECFGRWLTKQQLKGISRKQSIRWQHLSRLKASAFFSAQKSVVKKHNNLNLALAKPSSGWYTPIERVFGPQTEESI